jgi:hypothetical protein
VGGEHSAHWYVEWCGDPATAGSQPEVHANTFGDHVRSGIGARVVEVPHVGPEIGSGRRGSEFGGHAEAADLLSM